VQLALRDLLWAPPDPDGLAEAAHLAAVAGVLVQKPAPGRDDASRVPSELGHVYEQDVLRCVAQSVTQPVLADLGDRDHDRLVGSETVGEEGHGGGQEVVGVVPQQSLMPVGAAHWDSCR
jgi:hypothetical protein